ncbi:MAG: hypothetical protein OHK0039_24210 [Bacteroidia bacterium]
MRPLFFSLSWLGAWFIILRPPQHSYPRHIERNQMVVTWTLTDTHLAISMQAPVGGWVAIGLNPEDRLDGTNLYMGRVQADRAEVVEHYVLRPGDYRPLVSLGGQTAVSQVSGSQHDGSTCLHFRIDRTVFDRYHHALQQGQLLHLLMAYSLEDDFAHHSIMRTSVQIRL